MKKCFAGLLIAIVAIVLVPTKSFAVDTIPNTSVWFTPANAAAGTAITLNALVYNNQGKDATVVLNKDGEVITAWPNNDHGWRH